MVEGNNNFWWLSGILLQAQLFTAPSPSGTIQLLLQQLYTYPWGWQPWGLPLFMWQRSQGSNKTVNEALLDPGLQCDCECGQYREGIEGPSIGPISGSPFLVNSCTEALVVLGGAPPC